MLRVKFAAFIVLILLPSSLAVAAQPDDGSTAALPCNSLCQRWMGLATPPAPEEKPLATIDLHPKPLATTEAKQVDTSNPPLPPRRPDANRADGLKHQAPKATVLAKTGNPPSPPLASAPAVSTTALSVLGRRMASAAQASHAVLADPAGQGAAPQPAGVDIPNLPVTAWPAPVSTTTAPVAVGSAQVVQIPELPQAPPPPSRDDVLAMLPTPARLPPTVPVAPALPLAVQPAPVATETTHNRPITAATTMPPAFDVIAALILDGPRPATAR